jgi:hypothetical protein
MIEWTGRGVKRENDRKKKKIRSREEGEWEDGY